MNEKIENEVNITNKLHPNERNLLINLLAKTTKTKKTEEKSGEWFSIEEVANFSSLNVDAAMRSAFTLEQYGFVSTKIKKHEFFILTEEGKKFIREKFPEQRLVSKATSPLSVDSLTEEEKKIGIPWAIKNKWIYIKAGKIYQDSNLKLQDYEDYPLYRVLVALEKNEKIEIPELDRLIEVLCQRGSIEKKEKKEILIALTTKGIDIAENIQLKRSKGEEEKEIEIGELTTEIITKGSWREGKFRRYNVEAPVEKPMVGKIHPMTVFINKIRRIFLNMGFEEVSGPEIESAFWNFDALFQPQDHPARELHDTFYLSRPGYMAYPEEISRKVKEYHEKGWDYKWDPNIAEQAVLRTHTTAVSARTLAEIGERKRKPGKYFSIGKVFRNEAIDYKHLAELHQVEGIVVWKKANFRHLLGCLREFYYQLGFRKIKFVPHYFPYTEPSLEIHAYFEQKKEWIELGGAGIFRPELSIPLWGDYPVLAWGLGIERPLMMLLGIDDIRVFYQNDLDWLRNVKLNI